MIGIRIVVVRIAVVTLLGLMTSTHAVSEIHATEIASRPGVERASTFLKSARCGKYVLGYLHLGASYRGHSLKETREVYRDGKIVNGHFALVYAFRWENDGLTDVLFVCDANGRLSRVDVIGTNAVLQRPYAAANGMIQVLGKILLQTLGERLTVEDRQLVEAIVNRADAEGLMILGLKLQQTFQP